MNFTALKAFKRLIILFVVLHIGAAGAYAQTILNSLTELKAELATSDGNFKMAPGTYYFNTDNCGPGKLFSEAELLFFTGSNSTFDFTDVKFEYDTEIFTLYGNTDILEFWTVGNNNTYKNLTMEDIGMTAPTKGASSIHVDGADNLIEGFKTTTRGSFPYGYGDIFGKGGGAVIRHQKHAGILVRGDRNHVKNCTVIMRAYGHGIFMQGSEDALIEGCYVEGELRTVGEVLEEDGTNSPADAVDFLTVWGYHLYELEHNYRFSCQEDGIRCYTTGVPYGGEERRTTGTQIKNCTVVKMRSGVTIGWDYSNKVVNGCTVLACETGYWFGGNTTGLNNQGDASVGPLVSEDVSRSNSTMEVTLLDNYVPKIGNTPHFFYGGSNHSLIINDGTTYFDEDIEIQVGGKRQAHRWLEGSGEEPWDRTADNCTLINNTKYPVVLKYNAKNSDVTSCGAVTNEGTGNSITQKNDCDYVRACNNTPDNLQAECFDDMLGVETVSIGENNELAVSNIQNGDWISFNNIDLTNRIWVDAIAASSSDGVAIEVRQGATDGMLLGTIDIENTGDLTTYQTTTTSLTEFANGVTDIYFVFTGATGDLLNIDKLSFKTEPCSETYHNANLPISAEAFCDTLGVIVEDLSVQNQVVSEISEGDYIKYGNVQFGNEDTYNAIRILAASETQGTVEVRSGAMDGELLCTVEIGNTGSWNEYNVFTGYTSEDLTGTHDIFLVFKGEGEALMKIDNFYFLYDQCAGRSYEAYDRIEAEDYCEMVGVMIIDDYLGDIQAGDWIRFSNVNFTETSPLSVRVSLSGYDEGNAKVMLDDPREGTLLAVVPYTSSNGWTNWREYALAMEAEVTGNHDVYVFFEDGGVNINYIQFSEEFVKRPTDPFQRFEVELNDGERGVSAINTSDVDGGEELSELADDDFIFYTGFDLTEADSLYARIACAQDGSSIEVRVGTPGGMLHAILDVPNTGSVSNWQTVGIPVRGLEGENNIYFVFRGEGGDVMRVNWMQFADYTDTKFDRIESEDFDEADGAYRLDSSTDDEDPDGQTVESIQANTWLKFSNVDLTGVRSIKTRFGSNYSDGYIEVRTGAADGNVIGTINLYDTDSWNNWETTAGNIDEINGVHDLYFVFKTHTSLFVCYSNWFQFSELSVADSFNPAFRIEAEDYSNAKGTNTIATSDVDGNEEVASIQNGDWLMFENIDLTDLSTVNLRVACPNDGVKVRLRIDAYDGGLFGYISIPNTGGASNWQHVDANLFAKTGIHDVYVVFDGSGTDLLNFNWFHFDFVPTALPQVASEQEVISYPNPAQNNITIENQLNAQLEIYNMMGQKVHEERILSNAHTISIQNMDEGVYMVRIQNKGFTNTFQLIKQ